MPDSIKKVLIIEDQRDIRSLIQLTLEIDGYQITESSNGEDGFAATIETKPDLVLLDIMMPGNLNGLQVCAMIKAEPRLKGTKVVLLTAKSQLADIDLGRRAGCDEYLIKPFSPMELMDVASRLMS